jgi:hypothetical protein
VDFASLPLHDALLDSIELAWSRKACTLHVHAFVRKDEDATPYLLNFQEMSEFNATFRDSWGPSASLNSVTRSGNSFKIEMQSGDVIEIVAEAFEFVPL